MAKRYGDIELQNGAKVTGGSTPTGSTDLATKEYVDNISAGLDPKESVRLASTVNIAGTFASGSPAGVGTTLTVGGTSLLLDTVATINGDRVLLKDQTSTLQNGIYTVSGVGSSITLTRATDQDGSPSNEVSGGNFTYIEQGATFAGEGFVVIANGLVTIDIDAMVWSQFSGAAGGGLNNVVEDITPQLGGDLDANSFDIQLQDGTNAAPSLTFGSDTDTGMYRFGANNLSFTVGGSERLRLDSGGQIVGISTGAASAPTYTWGTDETTGIYRISAANIGISTGSNLIFSVNNAGIHMSSNNQIFGDVSTTIPAFSFEGDGNTGIYRPAADTVGVLSGGDTTASFAIDIALIGRPAPSAIIDGGDITLTGGVGGATSGNGGDINLTPGLAGGGVDGVLKLGRLPHTWPNIDGTSGQVLSTNGSGVLSWVTASGGGGATLFTDLTDTPIAPLTPGKYLQVSGGSPLGVLVETSLPYDLSGSVVGVPTVGTHVFRFVAHRALILNPLSGTTGSAACDQSTQGTVSSAIFDIHSMATGAVIGVGNKIGTITFPIGNSTGIVAYSAGTDISVPSGNEIVIVYATVDSGGTLGNVSFTLEGNI